MYFSTDIWFSTLLEMYFQIDLEMIKLFRNTFPTRLKIKYQCWNTFRIMIFIFSLKFKATFISFSNTQKTHFYFRWQKPKKYHLQKYTLKVHQKIVILDESVEFLSDGSWFWCFSGVFLTEGSKCLQFRYGISAASRMARWLILTLSSGPSRHV